MSGQRKDELIRWRALDYAQRGAMVLMLLCFSAILALLMRGYPGQLEKSQDASLGAEPTPLPAAQILYGGQAEPSHKPMSPLPTSTPPPDPSPTTPPPTHVGVVAGHWQYDSGAVCADGLREVDLTLPPAVAWISGGLTRRI
jgi:hypothetical protein